MRAIRTILLVAATAVSASYLLVYGQAVAKMWSTGLAPGLSGLEEPSFYAYRDYQHGPLHLPLTLFVLGPHEGPGILFRVPGWVPALLATAVAGYGLFVFSRRYERDPA